MADKHRKIIWIGQVSVEAALSLVILTTVIFGSARAWNWFVNKQLVSATKQYEASRVSAGHPSSAGRYQRYYPAPLNILGETGSAGAIIDDKKDKEERDRYLDCLKKKGIDGLQTEMEKLSKEIDALVAEMMPHVKRVEYLMELARDIRPKEGGRDYYGVDLDSKCMTGKAEFCYDAKSGLYDYKKKKPVTPYWCCRWRAESFEAKAKTIAETIIQPLADKIELKRQALEETEAKIGQIRDECDK